MKREWKTGDVALVTFDNATGNQRAQGISRIETRLALVDTGHVGTTAEPAEAWFVFGATSRIGATWESVREARPLVVIDPEDREQIERLAEAMLRNDRHDGRPCYSTACHTDRLAQSLRDFAIRKPDEPTGLGAVVEDAKGRKWVRSDETDDLPWHQPDSGDSDWRNFADIAAVRVLSEGVS